jgi:hypothetical protein
MWTHPRPKAIRANSMPNPAVTFAPALSLVQGLFWAVRANAQTADVGTRTAHFARASLEVRETPSGSLPRAIVNGGLDVVRVHLSSRLASLPS